MTHSVRSWTTVYAAYPTDVSALEQELDEKSRLQPQAGAMEKKTWIYELAAEKCRVKLFRHCRSILR